MAIKKAKRGRPKSGRGRPIYLTLDRDLAKAFDGYRAAHPELTSDAQAARRIMWDHICGGRK